MSVYARAHGLRGPRLTFLMGGLCPTVDSILGEKLNKDLELTRRALEKVRIVAPPRSYARRIAEDFLEMARAYFEDAMHFREKGEAVNAFACVNYAHGWLDAGARLGVFDTGQDERLFTLL